MKKKIYIITLIGKTMHEETTDYQNVETYRPECCNMKQAVELSIKKANDLSIGCFQVTDIYKSIRMIEI
ncbi:MAG: hypothetical protein QM660_10995 [Dysgonomonas sp.]